MPDTSAPVSMISALSLGPLPQILKNEMGDGVLRRVFHASGLSTQLLGDRKGYIPETALVRFFSEFAREAGQEWVLGPWLYSVQFSDYGAWAEWVLSAPTLRAALKRASQSIGLHGNRDKLAITTIRDTAYYSYTFAESMRRGYGELAIGGAAVLVSMCRVYLGEDWVPKQVHLNVADLSSRDISQLESWFDCPVTRSTHAIGIELDEHLLSTTRKPGKSAITYFDVAQERLGCRPTTLTEQVWYLAQSNLSDGLNSIDDIARALDMGVRRLQQRLQADGTSYRAILKSVRVARAQALLTEQNLTITEIAHELDYEHVAHFTRMFSTEMGMSPTQYIQETETLGFSESERDTERIVS